MTELKTHPLTVPGAVLDPLYVEKPSALYRTSFDLRGGDRLGASRLSHDTLCLADCLRTQGQPSTTVPLDEQLRLP
ncbi:hypothetical protein [Streptosporangium sp. 'caverna']|uniref:hypothetical protein n=1 Tax=Streptosporangium sp. 'caverna' TaxID=2202249 RepID=UPI000D7DC79E|nr:hypothetical protein [Streptosporangium sp. 'caverna']AWS41692.1 hypothetical protein DKM19_10350 [Streptosporangium sp. 'caverna']